MLADTHVNELKIDVDTKDGVVILMGDVAPASEKHRALEIVGPFTLTVRRHAPDSRDSARQVRFDDGRSALSLRT